MTRSNSRSNSHSLCLYPDIVTRRTKEVLIVKGFIKRTGAELIAHFPPNMGLAQAIANFEMQWFDCYDRNGICVFEDNDPMTMEEAIGMGIL